MSFPRIERGFDSLYLLQKMNLKDTYNKIAEDWTQDHKTDTWWIAGAERLASYLQAGSKIIDVGCAGGLKSEFLAKLGFQVTGIDLSDKMIELAKQWMPSGDFLVKDITEPLVFDHKFDAVFAQAVLLHVPKKNIPATLKNLSDVLKPKGYLYAAVKELHPGEDEEQNITENDYGYEYERFFSFFTLPEMEKYVKDLNMKIVYSNVDRNAKNDTTWVQVIAQKL